MRPLSIAESAAVLALVLIHVVVVGFPLWRIARKMGYPGALGLVALLPGINIILAWYLAFADWPRDRNNGSSHRVGSPGTELEFAL